MTTSQTPASIISRIEAHYQKLLELESLFQELADLRSEVHDIRTRVFGDDEPTVETPAAQLPAPKQVGMTVDGNGKRTMSPEARAHVSAGVKAAAARRKAERLAAATK